MKYDFTNCEEIIDIALKEDLGRGDITSYATLSPDKISKGFVISRQELVVSGVDVFAEVMRRVDSKIIICTKIHNGQTAGKDETILEVTGPERSMLSGERVALNFFARLCKVATVTRQFVKICDASPDVKILDTRKTTPGMRYMERKSVIDGGGQNHRFNLAQGILIKENHVAAIGSIAKAVANCKKSATHLMRIEVEVTSMKELKEALKAGADAILLDNMNAVEIKKCLKIIDKKVFVEASGGINIENAALIAGTGVDAISTGALTNSPGACDLSFLLEGACGV